MLAEELCSYDRDPNCHLPTDSYHSIPADIVTDEMTCYLGFASEYPRDGRLSGNADELGLIVLELGL